MTTDQMLQKIREGKREHLANPTRGGRRVSTVSDRPRDPAPRENQK